MIINSTNKTKKKGIGFLLLISLITYFLFSTNGVLASNLENKVRLLVITDASEPLSVDYRTVGNNVRRGIMGGSLLDLAISSSRQSGHSKRLQEAVGEFDRYPIVKKGTEAAFSSMSQYFEVDVKNMLSAQKEKIKSQLDEAHLQGYNYVLFLDERISGLVSAWKLGTLSATTTIKYELFDASSKKSMTKGAIAGWSKAIHEFDAAFSNRAAFIQEYEQAVIAATSTIFGQLNRDGHLHTMAATVGLGDYVPALGYFLDKYSKHFDYKFKIPKEWHEVKMNTKYSRIVEPKSDDKNKFGIRFEVDLLLKEFGQEVDDIDSYIALYVKRLYNLGYTLDDSTKISLTLNDKYSFLTANRPNNNGKEVYVFNRFGKDYVGIFILVFLEDFDGFFNKYKNDIEYLITNLDFVIK